MSENRPDGTRDDTGSLPFSQLGRILLILYGVLVFVLALFRARPDAAGVIADQRRAIEVEESGLLASPWFWRGLWILIGGLMLLLFLYEFFWLS